MTTPRIGVALVLGLTAVSVGCGSGGSHVDVACPAGDVQRGSACVTQSSPPPLGRLLLTGPTSHSYAPCQGSFFVAECRSALDSAGVVLSSPVAEEFIIRYPSAAAAAAADHSQQAAELSSGWLCAVSSQCPVTPVDVGPVGWPVSAVTFTIGARGNLSETTRLAAATKGRYLVNLSWISASTVSPSRVTPPDAARALLEEALSRIPA